MSSIWRQLKERKLAHWGLTYLAAAWLLFEVTDTVGARWNVPDEVLRGLFIVLSIGFVVLLVVAWYHGERGQQKVSGPELVIVATLLAIGGALLNFTRARDDAAPDSQTTLPVREGDDRPSIAVLTCTNMSPDPADQHLADGLHEEILLKLQKISSLFSIGRTSVLPYATSPRGVSQIATDLRVRYVGECSVRKQGERIRLTFQLLDGRTEGQVWTATYDTTLTARNLFDIQSDVAQQIAYSMRAVLSPEERARVDSSPTEDTEAYTAYLLGRYWWNQRTEVGLKNAIRQFDEAVTRDDGFALAYVGLADSYMVTPFYSTFVPFSEARARALQAIDKALEIDDRLGEAYASLGAVTMYFDWNWEKAEAEFRQAIDLSPRYAMAHQWLGALFLFTGRFGEAEERQRFALSLDPLYPTMNMNVADVLAVTGRHAEAIERLQRTLDLFPNFSPARESLSRVYVELGQYREAIELAPSGDFTVFAYRAMGRQSEAASLAQRIEAEGTLKAKLRARIGMGDVQGAFEALEAALDEQAPWLLGEPNIMRYYDSMHVDPRWEKYWSRIGISR